MDALGDAAEELLDDLVLALVENGEVPRSPRSCLSGSETTARQKLLPFVSFDVPDREAVGRPRGGVLLGGIGSALRVLANLESDGRLVPEICGEQNLIAQAAPLSGPMPMLVPSSAPRSS